MLKELDEGVGPHPLKAFAHDGKNTAKRTMNSLAILALSSLPLVVGLKKLKNAGFRVGKRHRSSSGLCAFALL